MSRYLITLILCLFSITAFAAGQGSLTVNIAGIQKVQGVMRIALFNSAENYAADTDASTIHAVQKAAVIIQNNQVSYTFHHLPYGDYAVKCFQDMNNTGKFTTNLFGKPTVPYGFSNDARGNFGPPTFAAAKFTLAARQTMITIHLNTP